MHAGEPVFRSLADVLGAGRFGSQGSVTAPELPSPPLLAAEPTAVPEEADPSRDRALYSEDVRVAVRQARLFCAALDEAFDAVVADLVRALATEVTARELRLGQIDVAQIARRLLLERVDEEPVRLHVAPADAGVVCELPVVVDPNLEPGDAILECRSGWVDARLGIRLAAVVAGAVR